MKNYGLSESQLFTLTRKNLEKRISQYYRETNDGDGALECLIALQVREELTEADFAFVLADLVRHIFMRTRSNRSLRRYYLFFTEGMALIRNQIVSSKDLCCGKAEDLVYTIY